MPLPKRQLVPQSPLQYYFPEDRPIFWGPNQLILEDAVYVEPSGWKFLEALLVPKVVRFLHDSSSVDSDIGGEAIGACAVSIDCQPDGSSPGLYNVQYCFTCTHFETPELGYFCCYQLAGQPSCDPDGWGAMQDAAGEAGLPFGLPGDEYDCIVE